MVATHRSLLTLSDVINRHDAFQGGGQAISVPGAEGDRDLTLSDTLDAIGRKAQREWFAAIAALEPFLLSALASTADATAEPYEGVILSGTTPVVSHPNLTSRLYTGFFTAEAWQSLPLMRLQLPSAGAEQPNVCDRTPVELPLFPRDPLAMEPFCLILTPHFGLLLVLGQSPNDLPAFQFSFDPATVSQAWRVLRSRLVLTHHPQLALLDRLFEQFTPPAPDYRWVTAFSRHLLGCLPVEVPTSDRKARCLDAISSVGDREVGEDSCSASKERKGEAIASFAHPKLPEMELLQALTHEIRTPLTTIRTLTRLLMRHKAVTPDMAKRLETIDQECTEQIDRMELIFSAAECNADAKKPVQLVPMSLEQVFGQGIPRWKRQAQRRNVDLEIGLPAKLPQVVSDPAMLDRVLTGLMEKFTRSLPSGGQIRVQVSTAGHQLKLQIHAPAVESPNPLKALGQLLMFQPATGSLTLNLDATKNLCHALGGKLIVRKKSEQGEELTIFLPLGNIPNRKVDSSLPRKE